MALLRRGLSGLGFTYYDLLDEAGREDCEPRDSRCVMRNSERVAAVQDAWLQYMSNPATAGQPTPQISLHLDTSDSAYTSFMNNQTPTSETIAVGSGPTYSVQQLETQRSTPAAPTGKAPSATLTSPRAGSTYFPGDQWTIKVTGAANAPVVVQGGKDGATDRTTMGSTNANGDFVLSGNFAADNVGRWSENWSVGGVAAGTISFVVTTPAAIVTPPPATSTPTPTTPTSSASDDVLPIPPSPRCFKLFGDMESCLGFGVPVGGLTAIVGAFGLLFVPKLLLGSR